MTRLQISLIALLGSITAMLRPANADVITLRATAAQFSPNPQGSSFSISGPGFDTGFYTDLHAYPNLTTFSQAVGSEFSVSLLVFPDLVYPTPVAGSITSAETGTVNVFFDYGNGLTTGAPVSGVTPAGGTPLLIPATLTGELTACITTTATPPLAPPNFEAGAFCDPTQDTFVILVNLPGEFVETFNSFDAAANTDVGYQYDLDTFVVTVIAPAPEPSCFAALFALLCGCILTTSTQHRDSLRSVDRRRKVKSLAILAAKIL